MGSKNKKNVKGQTVARGGENNGASWGKITDAKGDHGGGRREMINGGINRGGDRKMKIIEDSRFASLHTDPRFREAPKHKSKVAIDSRFNRMFTDKSFAVSSARIDKRGKARKGGDSSQHPLKHYYRLDDDEGKWNRREESGDEEAVSEGINEDNESEGGELKKVDEESSESASESSEGEEDGDDDDGIHTDSESTYTSTTDSEQGSRMYSDEEDNIMEENIPEIDKETNRLAVVNMDWNQVKADDLYVMLSSFLPKGGQIISVAIYPSEFGLKRMEEEALHGPVGLFDDEKHNDDDDDSDNDDNGNDEMENEKLRAYELSRLRYFYAVVECNAISTADYLYRTCDGVEFERSSNKLDLRFIPDSMEFKHAPRDIAKEAPVNYEGIDFHTRALQHSKIHLTWDEDEPQRSKTLKRKFNADQLAELELQEFLASEESDGDEYDNDTEDGAETRHQKKDAYRALIQSGNGSDGDEEEDDGKDMEVTFNTGLEDISKKILEKKDKKTETTWEAYLRKQREKKKARKNRSKVSSDDESDDSDQGPAEEPNDFFVEEPTLKENEKVKGKNGKKRMKGEQITEENQATEAELELLLADENGADTKVKGYNLKRKKAKGKKGEEALEEGTIPTIDFENDSRFSSIFTSPLFALDPTDPQFKRSAAYARQVAKERQKTGHSKTNRKDDTYVEAHVNGAETIRNKPLQTDQSLESKKEKYELSSMIKSVKMKLKQVPLPPTDKGTKRK